MNSLKNLLDTPVGVKTVKVEYEVDGMVPVLDDKNKPVLNDDKTPKMKKGKVTESVELVGMPDSTYLTLLQMPDNKKELRAKSFTQQLQARHPDQKVTPITADDVYNILLVHHYLPESIGMTDNDVAILSMEQGLVFGALLGGAMKIVGNTEEAQNLTPEQRAGLGNSSGAATGVS